MSKYFDFRGRSDATFQFFIGARGIGKSYSVYDEIVKNGERYLGESKWLYLRYSEVEIESSCGVGNIFKRINRDKGMDVNMEHGKNITLINQYIPFKSKDVDYETRCLGYAKSLDTFSSLRGVDFSDVDYIFFDEVIPETSSRKKPIYKVAGKTFENLYETVNRNRELEGREPVKCYFFGNPDSVYVDILHQFGIMGYINKMLNQNIKRLTIKERSIYMEFCEAEVSEMKGKTALYTFSTDDGFKKMAIENKFPVDNFTLIEPKLNVIEYNPIIQFKDISIMRHKSNGRLYARKAKGSAKIVYNDTDIRKFFKDFYVTYQSALIDKIIQFDSIDTKMDLDTALSRSKIK